MTADQINDKINNYSKSALHITQKGSLINKHYALAIKDLQQVKKDADPKDSASYQKAYITAMNSCNHWLKEYRKLLN